MRPYFRHLPMRIALLVLLSGGLGHCEAQHLTYPEWQERSFRDMRLMPMYGNRPKNEKVLASDSAFVAQTLAAIPDRRKASDHLAALGFGLLREGNMTHAMYRFNQAYLMDPKNPATYRGYGAFFMAMDRTDEAGRLFADGLALDSTDSRLMTDLSAAFLAGEFNLRDKEPEKADQLLNGAIGLLERALHQDPKSTEANFKLSVAHLRKGDCAKARAYRDVCKDLGGSQITPEYDVTLKARCP